MSSRTMLKMYKTIIDNMFSTIMSKMYIRAGCIEQRNLTWIPGKNLAWTLKLDPIISPAHLRNPTFLWAGAKPCLDIQVHFKLGRNQAWIIWVNISSNWSILVQLGHNCSKWFQLGPALTFQLLSDQAELQTPTSSQAQAKHSLAIKKAF